MYDIKQVKEWIRQGIGIPLGDSMEQRILNDEMTIEDHEFLAGGFLVMRDIANGKIQIQEDDSDRIDKLIHEKVFSRYRWHDVKPWASGSGMGKRDISYDVFMKDGGSRFVVDGYYDYQTGEITMREREYKHVDSGLLKEETE